MAGPTADNTDENFDKAIHYEMANLGVSVELNDNQLQALRAEFRGDDLIAVLPTVYGKIYQLLWRLRYRD